MRLFIEYTLSIGIIGQQSYLNPNEPDVYEYGQKPRERMLPLRLLTSQYNGDVDVVSKFLLGNDSGVILRRCTRQVNDANFLKGPIFLVFKVIK